MSQRPADSSTFEELVSRYARLIRSVVRRVAGEQDPAVLDDVEQQVLLSLWKATRDEQVIHHPSSYIYRTAVRETVRMLRRERTRREREGIVAAGSVRRVPDPEEIAESRELGVQVDVALKALSGDRSRAVRAHLAGFSVREIMDMFDWTYNRARNLIARGMADLRRELRAGGIDA